MTRLAVVVPAHNEQDLLPACLYSLAVAAARLPVTVELIVVADACTDDTAALAAAAGTTVLTTTARNVGKARAAGMRHDGYPVVTSARRTGRAPHGFARTCTRWRTSSRPTRRVPPECPASVASPPV